MKLYEIKEIANDTGVYAERGYNLKNFAKRIIELDRQQRKWVGLTDEEIDQGLVRTNYAMQTAGAWRDGVEWAIKQLKEKNT